MEASGWTCTICTYLNKNMTFLSCEMCGSIKNSHPKKVHPFFEPKEKVVQSPSQKNGDNQKFLPSDGEYEQLPFIDLSKSRDVEQMQQQHQDRQQQLSCENTFVRTVSSETDGFYDEKYGIEEDGFVVVPQPSLSDVACVSSATTSLETNITQTEQNMTSQPTLSRAQVLLRQHFNSDALLRPFQKRAILSVVVKGHDCLVISATGSGKSVSDWLSELSESMFKLVCTQVCFQLPPLILNGLHT